MAVRAQIATALVSCLLLCACSDSPQVVARYGDGAAGPGGCPWQSDELMGPAPIHRVNGAPSHFAVAFDQQAREFLFLFKPDSRPRSTQLLLQRFLDFGPAQGAPMEIQAELPWLDLAWRWDHRIAGLIAANGETLALWSQRQSPAAGVVLSELWLQRIQQGSPLGPPQKLLDLPSYLDAFAVLHTGEQLVVASVEDENATSPNMPPTPRLTLRRFDSAFAPSGAPLMVPASLLGAPLSQVTEMQLRGDGQHLGLLIEALHLDTSGVQASFVLVTDNEIVDRSGASVSESIGQPPSALGYHAGTFLRCSSFPSGCQLVRAASGEATGQPVVFSPPGVETIGSVRWHRDRFLIGAASADEGPAQRVLGWVDLAGGSGYQQIWSDSSLVFSASSRNFMLLPGGPDEIFWIDNMLSADAAQELNVLLKLSRQCP